MADTLDFITTIVTLSGGVSTLLVPRDTRRQYLAIQNTGSNPVTVGFNSSGVVAGQGVSLDPSATGLQGGVWEWSRSVPSNSIYGISALGTTVTVITG